MGTNGDGVIEYDEFMPAMLAVIASMKGEDLPAACATLPQSASADYDAQARQFLLKGMPADKLERTILRSFLFADTKNTGFLDESEFAACIQDLGLGLSPSHISELMTAVDKNSDGVIAYELMVKTVALELATQAAPAARPVSQQSGAAWKAIATSYEEAPAASPLVRPTVTAAKGPVPEL